MSGTGLLLIQLGTPEAPEPGPVRAYLREFLNDPRVLDINPIGRTALLNLVILPTRPAQSAEAYAKIWTDRGSPLLFHSEDLCEAVAGELGDGWRVALGMRYGIPSLASALLDLVEDGVDRVVALPLYPQYASSSTGTALEELYSAAAAMWNVPPLTAIAPFYDRPGFVDAFTAVARPVLDELGPDHVLFSYHGLPERHMRKSDTGGDHCLESADCCDEIVEANRHCYRAQCYATTRALSAALELDAAEHSVSFQSRLGRTPWIKPYTDEVLPQLARRGVKKLAVLCPSFVADCLETLEEVQIRGAEQFAEAGGDRLVLVPSLNSSPAWVSAVAAMARDAVGHQGSRGPSQEF